MTLEIRKKHFIHGLMYCLVGLLVSIPLKYDGLYSYTVFNINTAYISLYNVDISFFVEGYV